MYSSRIVNFQTLENQKFYQKGYEIFHVLQERHQITNYRPKLIIQMRLVCHLFIFSVSISELTLAFSIRTMIFKRRLCFFDTWKNILSVIFICQQVNVDIILSLKTSTGIIEPKVCIHYILNHSHNQSFDLALTSIKGHIYSNVCTQSGFNDFKCYILFIHEAFNQIR